MNSQSKIIKTDEEWKKELDPAAYEILRKKGTEKPFTGVYYTTKDKGVYLYAACGNELFSSAAKYDSGSGWPSFDTPLTHENLEMEDDESLGMRRVEVKCSRCESHLGHVFDDGPQETTGKRFCINSVALKLKKDEINKN